MPVIKNGQQCIRVQMLVEMEAHGDPRGWGVAGSLSGMFGKPRRVRIVQASSPVWTAIVAWEQKRVWLTAVQRRVRNGARAHNNPWRRAGLKAGCARLAVGRKLLSNPQQGLDVAHRAGRHACFSPEEGGAAFPGPCVDCATHRFVWIHLGTIICVRPSSIRSLLFPSSIFP